MKSSEYSLQLSKDALNHYAPNEEPMKESISVHPSVHLSGLCNGS